MNTWQEVAAAAKHDEAIALTVCHLIEKVGSSIRKPWDWEWLSGRKEDFGSLITDSLLEDAWPLLLEEDWLSLQVFGDDPKVSNLEPLAALRNLRTLDLEGNCISDISPLAELEGLRVLGLKNNAAIDLGPLSRLRSLEELDLAGNPVESMAVLERLPSLKRLSITGEQADAFGRCRMLPALQRLSIPDLKTLDGFPDMPALGWLWSHGLQSLSGLERFRALSTLDIFAGSFSDLGALRNLKHLTHLYISTEQAINLEPLGSVYSLRSVRINALAVDGLSVLGGLPALHEVSVENEVKCDRIGLEKLTSSLTPWESEFKEDAPKTAPSLELCIVSQAEFYFYAVEAAFGVEAGEYECGMFHSEKNWLFDEIESALGVEFEREADFMTPSTSGGFRRSGELPIYSLRAYESFRQIVTMVQEILCSSRKPWIVYFQSFLLEGPDAEEIPKGTEDFSVWIYPDKIVATEANAEIVRKLIEFKTL